MAIIEIENLSFSYNNTKSNVLSNINLQINQGDFVVICGQSGCGKTTLVRLMKKQLCPNGTKTGSILYDGTEVCQMDDKRAVKEIGFVMQNPDNQIVADKVWHELCFGLENLGESPSTIRRRVAEVSSFFGINDWYHKKIEELSGGQKQLLNLASIMALQPKVLILDEPTSQLDPIASSDFIQALHKLNYELGITIVLVEHRLEEVFPIASKIVIMENSQIIYNDTPKNIGKAIKNLENNDKINSAMPSSIKIFNKFDIDEDCPLTVRDSKNFLKKHFRNDIKSLQSEKINLSNQTKAIEISGGFFRYERQLPDVIKNLDLEIYENEILCILGGNGVGKTTLLKVLSGIKRLYKGKLRVWDKKLCEYKGNSLYRNNIACLPQNPQSLFLKEKVIQDLQEITKIMQYSSSEGEEKIFDICNTLDIGHLLDCHPYDISGGEQQKVALAKILLMQPKILLLDEPTIGIDAYSKKVLADILFQLKSQGKTIVIVSHDIEFCAQYADRCAMFFDGQIVSVENPIDFFSSNSYYTTMASRISKEFYDKAITCDMVIDLCNKNGIINS